MAKDKNKTTKQNPVAVREKRTATTKKRNIPYQLKFPPQNIVAELDEDTWLELEELNMFKETDGRFVLVYLLDNTEELLQDDSPEYLRAKAIRYDWQKEDYYIIDLETMQPYQNNPIFEGRMYSHEIFNKHKQEIIQEFTDMGFTDLFINETLAEHVYIIPQEQRKESREWAVNNIREDKELMEGLNSLLDEEK